MSGGLSRRGFVRAAGITALTTRAGLLQAKLHQGVESSVPSARPNRFAFVGVMGDKPGVYVYAIDGEMWRLRQIVSSEAPISLALHPSGHSLYVINEVSSYRGLPRGSVEAYGVDANSGQLNLLGREGLSLSATMPRHLAVAPDGKSVVVAVHGGGAYNQLPILTDGYLGRVSSILKETGCGPAAEHQEAAHPQTVLFDTTGKRVIAADLGCDKVNVLSMEDGLEVLARHDMPAGSAPQHLALHPTGHLLYVAHALDGSLAGFAYDAGAGKIMHQVWQGRGEYGDALAMHPAGDFLYTAGGGVLTAWRIEPATGTLRSVQSHEISGNIHGMTVRSDGRQLLALTSKGILEIGVDTGSGRLAKPALAVPVSGARSIALQS
jgi:6-phosphogluconolactonase